MPHHEPVALAILEPPPVGRDVILGWGEAWRSVTELDLCLYLLERALVAHAGLVPTSPARTEAWDSEWLAAYA